MAVETAYLMVTGGKQETRDKAHSPGVGVVLESS